MQGLFKKLFLVSGVFSSLGLFAQSHTNETTPPVNNQPTPAISNGAFNNNNSNIRLEEKAPGYASEAEEKQETVTKPGAFKKAETTLTRQELQTATQARMQQQFTINQSNASRQYSRRSATAQEQAAMDESVLFFKATAPESFESAYYSWLAGHYNLSRVADLRKAEKLQPGNINVLKQKAMYYAAANQPDSLNMTLEALDTLGYYTEGQIMYVEDLLLSCDDNSTLIVHGFDDFLAAAYINYPVQRINIVSLDLMQSEDYRDLCAKDLSIPEQKEVNVEFLQKLCSSSRGPLFLSMTIPSNYFQPLKNDLYVQGLTFVYDQETVDTYRINDQLWFQTMNRLLLTRLETDNFRGWISNYKVLLSVLKNQLAAHQSEIPAEDYDLKLEDIDNQLEYIIQNGR